MDTYISHPGHDLFLTPALWQALQSTVHQNKQIHGAYTFYVYAYLANKADSHSDTNCLSIFKYLTNLCKVNNYVSLFVFKACDLMVTRFCTRSAHCH